MKTVYIPKGETVHYESLTTEHLVVHGRLHVTYGVKAQSITGSGVIDAGSINADTVCIDDVESGTVICKRLIAKRVQAPEVFASESAAVSCFLSAAYVETGKLTAAISEVDEVVAQEVVNLTPKKRTLFGTLFASMLRSFWTALTAPGQKAEVKFWTLNLCPRRKATRKLCRVKGARSSLHLTRAHRKSKKSRKRQWTRNSTVSLGSLSSHASRAIPSS